jgi:hypothetical protein
MNEYAGYCVLGTNFRVPKEGKLTAPNGQDLTDGQRA